MTINTTGHEKDRFTVMLTCTTDGDKLPTYVMLKGKTMPKDKFPAGITVRAQQKWWIDKGLVQDWVHTFWSSRPDGSLPQQWNMLVLDVFSCHKIDDTKQCSVGPTLMSSSSQVG